LLQTAFWKPYTLAPGSTLDLPTPPKESKSQKKGPDARVWTAVHSERTVIVVAYEPVAADSHESPDQVLANAIAGQVTGSHGTLLSQRDILFQGWPGVEIGAGVQGGMFARTRIYALSNAILELTVVGDTTGVVVPPADRLFGSLKLTSSIGSGPYKTPGPQFKRYGIGNGASAEFPSSPQIEDVDLPPNPISRAMQRYAAPYGNRMFMVGKIEIPADQQKSMTPARTMEVLQQLNQAAMTSLGISDEKSKKIRIGTDAALSTTGTFEDGKQTASEIGFLRGSRLYLFLCWRPTALQDSPEVDRFLNSFQIDK